MTGGRPWTPTPCNGSARLAWPSGGGAILAVGQRRTPDEERQTIIHGTVPLIAACAYLAMAVGQGSVLLPSGREFYFMRYVDWLVTTPLLLAALSISGVHEGRKPAGLILGLLLADVMMVVTGFGFGASEGGVKWTWYLISCGAFAAVGWVVWRPLQQANARQRDDVRAKYQRNALVLTALWSAYPLVVIPAPDGLGIMPEAVATALLLLLDWLSKVAYGWASTKSDTAITTRDLAEGTASERRPA